MKYYIYGKLDENGIVKDVFTRPDWINDDGEIVSEDFLKSNENIFPINTTLDLNINTRVYNVVQNDKSKFILNPETDVIENYFSYIQKSTDEILNNSLMYINEIKNSKIYSDISYEFSPNNVGHIQLRNSEDLANIRALGFNAGILNPNGYFNFIDAENNLHKLSSEDVLNLVKTVEEKLQHIFNIAYLHKVKLRQLLDINELITYDFDYGW